VKLPHARFYNLYGPTETNVCTYHEVDREAALVKREPLPIGAAIDNVDVFAIDDAGEVVTTPGRIGELWVRGAGLACGYLGDPEATARGFVTTARRGAMPDRAYRTGDRVELMADGRSYEVRGRLDHQIKTRGHRVELGEIESALAAHPRVASAAAIGVPDELVGHRIHAFVVASDGGPLDEAELQAFCRDRVPHYMVPERIATLPSLPLTSSGKLDRKALVRVEEAA
jgi:acyl-CoA synthetase (AMP-forming)/AMP-acid ligase II